MLQRKSKKHSKKEKIGEVDEEQALKVVEEGDRVV